MWLQHATGDIYSETLKIYQMTNVMFCQAHFRWEKGIEDATM